MITAHMMVKNEDQWVWYAIQSVLPYVDRFLICDTGSTDNTCSIIQTIKSKKISFSQISAATPADMVAVRNQQLNDTKTDWLWMVDGDEIYPKDTAQEIVNHLQSNLAGIVVRRHDCLGDIFHYQSNESVGAYTLAGRTGHYNLRLINCRLKGLHLSGSYPNEGFCDGEHHPLVEYPADRFYVTDNPYIHTTYLSRSSLGGNLGNTLYRQKYKYEIGALTPSKLLQDMMALQPPKNIPRPLHRGFWYTLIAGIVTPIKILKRKV